MIPLLNLKTPLIAFVIGASISGITSWRVATTHANNQWQLKIDKQKTVAAKELQAATERVVQIERKQAEVAQQLEVQHVKSQQQLDAALADNRSLSNKLGGLRDPGHRSSCPSPLPSRTTTPSSSEDSTAGNRLSTEASDFLLELARDADKAAEYANTCHQWVNSH